MKDNILRPLRRYQQTFGDFTPAQKVIALLGTGALILAGVLVFRWVAQPAYSPLYSNLSASDASAVVDKLDSSGVSYQLTNGGSTVMVPKDDVYKTRISLSGQGLPASTDGGYSLLDNGQSLSTSSFKEQTDFKRAMEGELAKTIEAINGVQTAVVHLALPEKQVFADKQDPPTASVLVATKPGTTLTPDQVQGIVHLVAASIDGHGPRGGDRRGLHRQAALHRRRQRRRGLQLARPVRPPTTRTSSPRGCRRCSTASSARATRKVEVAADLNFDKSIIESKKYANPTAKGLALSTNKSAEIYKGPAGSSIANGVVGPDGQMGTSTGTGTAGSSYDKSNTTQDNALDTQVEHREAALGTVNSLHISTVLDRTAAANTNPSAIAQMVRAAAGLQPKRGDTNSLQVLPFDRTAETQAAKDLKAAQATQAKDGRMGLTATSRSAPCSSSRC